MSSCVYDCVSIIQRFNNPNTPKVYSLLQRDFSLTLNLTTTLPLTLLLVERKCGDWVNVFWSARGKTLKFSDYRIAFRLSSCPRVCRSVAVEAACWSRESTRWREARAWTVVRHARTTVDIIRQPFDGRDTPDQNREEASNVWGHRTQGRRERSAISYTHSELHYLHCCQRSHYHKIHEKMIGLFVIIMNYISLRATAECFTRLSYGLGVKEEYPLKRRYLPLLALILWKQLQIHCRYKLAAYHNKHWWRVFCFVNIDHFERP